MICWIIMSQWPLGFRPQHNVLSLLMHLSPACLGSLRLPEALKVGPPNKGTKKTTLACWFRKGGLRGCTFSGMCSNKPKVEPVFHKDLTSNLTIVNPGLSFSQRHAQGKHIHLESEPSFSGHCQGNICPKNPDLCQICYAPCTLLATSNWLAILGVCPSFQSDLRLKWLKTLEFRVQTLIIKYSHNNQFKYVDVKK
jgi:hypothetical protein